MAGIYIHVPFCTKRCYYCDFYSSVNTKLTEDFVSSIIEEIENRSNFFTYDSNSEISTIYFGGGTPSLLSPGQLEKIFAKLYSTFRIAINAEITFEANPDDLQYEYISAIKNLGVNRLSIGIQSFNNTDLKLMNRRHNAAQANESIENAIKAGITNLSIDLIYGLPGMNSAAWQQNLQTAFQLPISHLSAYHLGIELNTVFSSWLKKGKIQEIPDEESWQQFFVLHEMAISAGFEHYEISNLSKPGFESKHNTSYWNSIPFIGLGPSAHSFNGSHRFWNVSNINSYIEAISQNKSFSESEFLTNKDKANEYIMTGLRTNKGINLDLFQHNFGDNYCNQLKKALLQFNENEHYTMTQNQLLLTLKGWFISDKIIRELMVE